MGRRNCSERILLKCDNMCIKTNHNILLKTNCHCIECYMILIVDQYQCTANCEKESVGRRYEKIRRHYYYDLYSQFHEDQKKFLSGFNHFITTINTVTWFFNFTALSMVYIYTQYHVAIWKAICSVPASDWCSERQVKTWQVCSDTITSLLLLFIQCF